MPDAAGRYLNAEVIAIERFLEDQLSVAESAVEDIDGLESEDSKSALAGQYQRWRKLMGACVMLLPLARNLPRR